MLTVITGPMWSGKSDELIKSINDYNDKGFKIYAFNSAINHRDCENFIESRTGASWESKSVYDVYFDSSGSFHKKHTEPRNDVTPVVAIDEGQFFGDHLLKMAVMARRRGAKFELIVAGLLLDSEGRPFGPMATLRSLANKSIDVTAWCEKCNGIARFTYSRTLKSGQVRVGDEDYEPRCEVCYKSGETQKASVGYLS
jgi:thymidine kinase